MLLPRLLFATGLMALAVPALAARPDIDRETIRVLTLTLFAPLDMRECPTTPTSSTAYKYATHLSWTKPCYMRGVYPEDIGLIGSGKPLDTERVHVYWPKDKHPSIAVPGTVQALLIHGLVHGIYAHARGLPTQNEDLQELIRQFGPPDYPSVMAVKNTDGTPSYSLQVAWDWPGKVDVFYSGGLRPSEAYPGRFNAITEEGMVHDTMRIATQMGRECRDRGCSL